MKRFSSTRRLDAVHDHVRDEAVSWFIGFCEDEVDADGCARFERWLKASPEHVQAYLQVSAFWEAAGRLNGSRKVRLDELVARAAAETNVVALEPTVTRERKGFQGVIRWDRRPRAASFAAAVAFLCLLGVAAFWWQRHAAGVYKTAVGEERTLILPDSSTVELDARSEIRVRFTKAVRTVDLLQGQALFRVTHDSARPFVVTSNDTHVRDVGTQFDVRRDGVATVVTVLEGRVAAFTTPEASSSIGKGGVLISAGEQVILRPQVALRPVRVNTFAVTAWTQGKLVFDGARLGDVIQAFNRYNPKPITIDDAQLLSLHVSGTFDTANSTQLIQFLSQRFGLVAHDSADGVRLSRE